METKLKERYERISPFLDERTKRLFVANEAIALGFGGITDVSRITGVTRPTITRGIAELSTDVESGGGPTGNDDRIRNPGGGRKLITQTDPTIVADLTGILEPITRGDPESPLLWTSKSLRNLADELRKKGHKTSHVTVGTLLKDMGFSLQADYKNLEPGQHPDRNEQFEYIYATTRKTQSKGLPVISVDTKKRELVGEFKNNGREWHPKGAPTVVDTHDFEDKELGHAIPFGVYDLSANNGWVSVGITKDISQFAANSVRSWWEEMGKDTYPNATELQITADSGGSNGYRRRLWKVELQRLADETGLVIHMLHFPPGTSKWNRIEHRMFSQISKNWRGRPLVSLEVIVSLIAATTTQQGIAIRCAVDDRDYETGLKVTDEDMEGLSLQPDEYHGEWNYQIFPRKTY
ncbi:MAG: ISAzo13 family transposase [Gracilibacteraceae bacterium]|jgi:hypothetical protein|nr:ISAzo13 family transposase [Gracilibacteraceae bacterium]